jgi:hypothetical protein
MIEYNIKKKGIIFQYPFFKSWRIQEAKSSQNIRQNVPCKY